MLQCKLILLFYKISVKLFYVAFLKFFINFEFILAALYGRAERAFRAEKKRRTAHFSGYIKIICAHARAEGKRSVFEDGFYPLYARRRSGDFAAPPRTMIFGRQQPFNTTNLLYDNLPSTIPR